MLDKNTTPYAAIAFKQMHRDGYPMAVITCRGTYNLSRSGELTLADKQSLVMADEYEGDPQKTPLTRAGEIIPFKPRSDITVQGSAYPPGGKPSKQWRFGLRIGSFTCALRANGWRHWEPVAGGGWRLGEAEPIAHAPLDWQYAAGGRIIGDPEAGRCDFNPLGKGVLHPEHSPKDARIVAPVIDSEAAPVTDDPFAEVEPQGLGPIPPFWRFRLRHGGTYDDNWTKNRHPQLPADFDYRFYQTAHPALIYPGYLKGDETVQFVGLTPDGGELAFALPGRQPWATFNWIDDRSVMARLHLDGLHIDLRDAAPWRVDLTWRAWAAICPQFFKIDLYYTSLKDPALARLMVAGEDGLMEPVPA